MSGRSPPIGSAACRAGRCNSVFGRRIGWKSLAQVCRRLGTSLHAGIDVRRVIQRETETGSTQQRKQFEKVKLEVDQGTSLSDSLRSTGDYFPRFFLEMVHIGEQTGKLDHVLPQLAAYYEHLVLLRNVFLLGIAWPAVQLTMALGIIGLLIVALGWVAQQTGEATDILGFGLVGTRGLVRYITGLGALFVAGLLAYRFLSKGIVAEKVAQTLMRVPGVGPVLRVTSLSRFAWSLGLALDSGADARKSVQLALVSTQNQYYTRHADEIDRQLRKGDEIYEALLPTGAFPVEFLDALQVGEQSGNTSESLLRLADRYRDQAKTVMRGLTLMATVAVWFLVGMMIILLIFRIFSFYLGILQEATQI